MLITELLEMIKSMPLLSDEDIKKLRNRLEAESKAANKVVITNEFLNRSYSI